MWLVRANHVHALVQHNNYKWTLPRLFIAAAPFSTPSASFAAVFGRIKLELFARFSSSLVFDWLTFQMLHEGLNELSHFNLALLQIIQSLAVSRMEEQLELTQFMHVIICSPALFPLHCYLIIIIRMYYTLTTIFQHWWRFTIGFNIVQNEHVYRTKSIQTSILRRRQSVYKFNSKTVKKSVLLWRFCGLRFQLWSPVLILH